MTVSPLASTTTSAGPFVDLALEDHNGRPIADFAWITRFNGRVPNAGSYPSRASASSLRRR